jgi:predicted HAD superfamily Cof-like phosphohydrolase
MNTTSEEQIKENKLRILKRIENCLMGNPDGAGLEGLTLMGMALLLQKSNSTNVFSDVRDFHKEMGIPTSSNKALTKEAQAFRATLLDEEVSEYHDAVAKGKAEKEFDALIDIMYICAGTIAMHGWKGEVAWDRVHAANMKKQPSPIPTKRAAETGQIDVIKPKGWKPPVLADLV